MKNQITKRLLSFVLAFIMMSAVLSFAAQTVLAATEQEYEAVYQWNLAIYSSNSNSKEALDYYKQPTAGDMKILSDNSEIAALAKSVTDGKYEDYEKARAIYEWVANNIWYDYDLSKYYGNENFEELNQIGMDMFQKKRGVCGFYAELTVALLRASGIPAKYVSGYALGNNGVLNTFLDLSSNLANHTWTEAYINGKWIIIDTTWASYNYYINSTYSQQYACDNKYFNISLEEISKTHKYELWYDNFVTEVFLPDGLAEIWDYTFYGYENLTRIIIPGSVKSIGKYAFMNCTNLTGINIPDSVTSIGNDAFAYCKNLTKADLPDGITAIGERLFINCESLKNIIIPDSVTSIGNGAFGNCGSLTDINIPPNVEYIGSSAFSFCNSLTKIILPPKLTGIGLYTFAFCGNMSDIYISDSVTGIGEGAFAFCENLTNINIPDSITSIGDKALHYCVNLKNIFIPKSVTNIGKEAFYGCSDLTIYGDTGSYTEIYAKKNNIKFVDPFATAADWARDGIKSAIAKGFVPANIQDNYANVITRAEFCRMAVKFVEYATDKSINEILKEKGVSRDSSVFSDTKDPDILAAYALGITNGTGGGKFTPGGAFDRQQAATMLMRVCGVLGMDINNPPDSGFSDFDTADDWASDGINFCYANNIMIGTGNNNFSPKQAYTIQQSILTFDRIK